MLKFLTFSILLYAGVVSSKCDFIRKGVSHVPPQLPVHLRSNVWQAGFDEVHDGLCRNLRSPSRFFPGFRAHPGPPYKSAYLWDTAFISQIWMHWDPKIAEELIKYVLKFQKKDGKIHHAVLELVVKPYPYSESQPPLLAWASWRIFEKSGDKKFLEQSYDKLKKYHEWMNRNRKNAEGLYFWIHPYESGIDNSPRFSNASESYKANTKKMAAVDLASYMGLSMEALAKMARVLGKPQDETAFLKEYEDLKLLVNKKHWHAEDGTYYDWDYSTSQFVRMNTISNLTPMVAGFASTAQATELMKHVMDPLRYNTLMPFPSVAKNDPSYSKDMWRGPVWVNMAYLGVLGVERYGYHKEASELARRVVLGIYETYHQENYIFEFYDPERYDIVELWRKKGNLWKRLTLGSKPVKNFVGWSGLANTLVMEYGAEWSP